jgi:hypothetical protein
MYSGISYLWRFMGLLATGKRLLAPHKNIITEIQSIVGLQKKH